ncbi:MAG: PH domain-containing protein [Hyphomonadaceae bacterium]
MSYIDKSLAPGEDIIVRGKWPTIYWVGAWLALIFLGILLVGVYIFIAMAIHMSVTQFAVTDRRVVLKRGWLNVHTKELATETVEGVQVVQSIWGKLFGYGRIVITGTGDARIVFPPMAHPIAFRRAIESTRHANPQTHIAHEDIEELAEAANGHRR